MKLPFSSNKTFALAISSLVALSLCQAADAPAYTGTPYGGKPQEIPGVIQAGNYDVAPSNAMDITQHRKGTPKPGKARTTGDCIGFGGFDGSHYDAKGKKLSQTGFYVGWTDAGDWWKYTVKVNDAGTYDLGAHLSSGRGAGKISVTFTPLNPAGADITAAADIPTSVGLVPGVETYHVWQDLTKLAQVKLTPGTYVMTVKIETTGGMNLDTFTFTKE